MKYCQGSIRPIYVRRPRKYVVPGPGWWGWVGNFWQSKDLTGSDSGMTTPFLGTKYSPTEEEPTPTPEISKQVFLIEFS